MLAAWIAGGLDLGFAVFHILFWRLFGWPGRLEASGQTNAAITQTLNIVLIFIFIVYGIVLLGHAHRGVPVPLPVAGVGAAFWGLRMLLQPLMFSMRNVPSWAITCVFAANAAVHAWAGWEH